MVPPPLPPLSLEKKKFTRMKEERREGGKKEKTLAGMMLDGRTLECGSIALL